MATSFDNLLSDEQISFQSDYIMVNDLNESFSKYKLNVLHLNIHGLYSKKVELQEIIRDCSNQGITIHVLLLCETFLNDSNKSLVMIENYIDYHSFRAVQKGGGVSIYVHDSIQSHRNVNLSIFKEGAFESLFVDIEHGTSNVLVGEIYRVPNTSERNFLEDYEKIISKVPHNTIIGMDQNLDYLKIDTHNNTRKFFDLNLSHGQIPAINKPTRLTTTTSTLIDNITIDLQNSFDSFSAILLSDISDHLPCLLFTNIGYTHEQISNVKTVIRLDHDSIDNALSNINWTFLDNKGCEEAYDSMMNGIQTILNSNKRIVKYRMKGKHGKNKWFTGMLRRQRTKKLKLYKKWIHSKDQRDLEWYQRAKHTYTENIKIERNSYFESHIKLFKDDSKKFWKFLNSELTSSTSEIGQLKLKINNIEITDRKALTRKFNNYFSTIGQNLANNIPPSMMKPEYNLTFEQNSIFITPTCPTEIEKIVTRLKNKKSSGYDGISNDFVKRHIQNLKIPLSKIVNKSISDGVFPQSMKLSKIIPIYKKGSKSCIENYRPISLLPVFSKILEKVMYKRIYCFLENNNLLYKSQYGFRSKHSTNQAITEFLLQICRGVEDNDIALGIFLDLSKAFDTISHDILKTKLQYMGIRGMCYDWLVSYLNNRCQYVSINDVDSEIITNSKFGVPQGSVLGPLLFIIYCTDLHRIIENGNVVSFADDTNILYRDGNVKSLESKVNDDLTVLNKWFACNKLSLNVQKTNYCVYSKRKVTENALRIHLSSTPIRREYTVKFLGLYIDDKLMWTPHVKFVSKKISPYMYVLKRLRNCINTATKKLIYNSFILPHLHYGIINWASCSIQLKHEVQTKQNKIVRSINNNGYLMNTLELYKLFGILTIEKLYKSEILKFGWQLHNDKLPNPVSALFMFGNHRYHTRNRNQVRHVQHTSQILHNSLLNTVPRFWNELPQSLKTKISMKSFVKSIKQYLLDEIVNSC